MKILQTERLVLRPPRAQDADRLTRLLQDRRIVDMTAVIPWPYRREDAVGWLADTVENGREGDPLTFAITRRGADELLGVIGIHPAEHRLWAAFGYWLGVEYWGRGYMTEALCEILRYGFEELGFRRMEAFHFAHNPASGRVMQKAGLRHEGVQRLRARRFEKVFDRVNYGITDEEWRAAAKGPR